MSNRSGKALFLDQAYNLSDYLSLLITPDNVADASR